MDAPTITRIIPPPDFPVQWENSEDENYHWTRDREHMPHPITPMFSSFSALTASEGRRRTVPVYDEAILERRDLTFNTYGYTRLVPFTGSSLDIDQRVHSYKLKTTRTADHLQELWENEWKPEIEAHWDFWARFNLSQADLPGLAAHLEETIMRATRLQEIHYLMGPPMWFAIDEFEKYYCDLIPGAQPLDAHRLLQGFHNKTIEINQHLYQLSTLARKYEIVRQAITTHTPHESLAILSRMEAAQAFLESLNHFLASYGRRSDLWDWGYPSWQDDPSPVLMNIRSYLAQPERDLPAELALAAEEREAAIAQTRQAILGYPGPVRERFEKLLKNAQVALVLTENHTYYMDFNGFGWVRRAIHEFGRRFAREERLDQADDVFCLKIDELRKMIANPARSFRETARQRRAEIEHWSSYNEPAELGLRPYRPIQLYSPDARRMLQYIGGFVAELPASEPEPGVLSGQAGSAGKVCGPARVILSLADAGRLQPGDILVTTTTAPLWTPLFLTAAGLVTDAGGLLSHGAVVSREFRIPAVVGTRRATTSIQDGQWIEVDGDLGMVRMV